MKKTLVILVAVLIGVAMQICWAPSLPNSLWVQINSVSNNLVYLVIHGTTNGTQYEISSKAGLTNETWNSEGLVWGDATTNWTAATVALNGRSGLFFRAQSLSDTGDGSSGTLTMGSLPTITTQPSNQTVLAGSNVTFSIGATGTGYQWRRNGSNLTNGGRISGANTSTLTLTNVNLWDSGIYTVVVSNITGSVTSTYAMLRVWTPSSVVAWGCYARDETNSAGQYDNAGQDAGQIDVPPGLTNAVAVAGGFWHSLALRSDGTVVVWGDNEVGQTNVPPNLTNVVAIAAGANHSLALKSDGTVVAWGYNVYGQTNVPSGLSNVVAIGGTGYHCLALKNDGTVVAWGSNGNGQTNVPSGLSNVIAVAGGYGHSLALKSDGTLVAWGNNDWGQTNIPSDLTNAVAIVAGLFNNVVLKSDGTVAAWGHGNFGETNVPTNLSNVVAISAAGPHSLVLKRDGTVTNWGDYYTLDASNYAVWHSEPPPPAGLTNVVAIAEGWYHSLALGNLPPSITTQPQSQTVTVGGNVTFSITATGTSYQWQRNGSNLPGANSNTLTLTGVGPQNAGIYTVVVSNAAGTVTSTYAMLRVWTPSRVVAWGDNTYGQTNIPSGLTNAVAIAGGWHHSLALKSDGKVIAWGDNANGQTNVSSSLINVVAVAGGYEHSLSLKSDGKVVAWGGNSCGETNVPGTLTNAVAISAVGLHSLALKSDGTVVAWGDNYFGQINVPSGLTNVVAVAGGGMHSLALKSDGKVVAWGDNEFGQTNVPSNLTNVVAIAGGYFHSLALKGDGTVVAWGVNDEGETNVPSSLMNATAVAGGWLHSLALKSDGTVVAWNNNDYGQTNIPSGLANVVAIAAGGMHSLALGNLTSDLVAWWKFDEGTGTTTADSSGNGNNGTLIHSPTWVTTGMLSNALSFDGINNQYVQVQTTGTVRGAFTVAAWVLPLDPAAIMNVFNTRGGSTSDNSFDFKLMGGGQIHGDIGSGFGWITVAADANFQYTTGTWYHIACVVTPTNYTIYANGTAVGGKVYNAAEPLLYDVNHPIITIGTEPDTSSKELFNGKIDDVRVYDQALTPDEMAALYNVDTIGDGIPNWWRQQYFGCGSTTNCISCASADPDCDGFTNLQEYRAGMDPLHPPLPTFNPDGGAYLTPQSVTINYSVVGATNHYTTNGLVPMTSDPVIAPGGMVVVNKTMLLRARAFKSGMTNSDTKNALYQIGAQVAAGGNHSFALTTNGTLWTWGQNNCGQLGDGTTVGQLFPELVSKINNVRAVAGGSAHSVVLCTNGTVWTWGNNDNGQLGNGTTTRSSIPVPVSGVSNVVAVAAKDSHSMALRTNGTVWTWGDNTYGELGIGSSVDSTNMPVQAVCLTQVMGVAAGNSHDVALRTDGTVWTWGNNDNGQLGNGITTDSSTPVRVSGMSNVVAVAAGAAYSVALRADGTVWAWGYNGDGELGNGTTDGSSVPVQVNGLNNVVAIAAGQYHTLAVTATGWVYSWGGNGYGQLGNNTTDNSSVPIQVSGLSNMVAVAAGDYHSLAVKSDGTIWSWGYNYYGQLGRCTTDDEHIPGKVGLSVNSSPPVMATVSGNTSTCGGWTTIQAALTGTGPWTVTWSDGEQDDVTTSPIIRNVCPNSTTTYTIIAVSDSTCTVGISLGSATVTVNQAPSITLNPVGQIACASPASFTAAASGSPAPTVQWQVLTNNGAWRNISGATNGTLIVTVNALNIGNQYRAVFTNPCGTATSTAATLDNGAVTPSSSSIGCGDSVTITLLGNTTNLAIQWQLSVDYCNTWTNIAGATNTVLHTGPLTVGTYYYHAMISNSVTKCSVTSPQASVSVDDLNGGTATAASSWIVCGDSTTIILSDYTTNAAIQWQVSDGSTWVNIAGATNAVLYTGSITTETCYRAMLSNPGCSAAYSSSTCVYVEGLYGGSASALQSSIGCGGTVTLMLSGYTTGAPIQWQASDGGTWRDIPGATRAVVYIGPVTTDTSYRAMVGSGGCSVYSSSTSVTIIGLDGVIVVADPPTMATCGDSVKLTLSGYPADATVQWQASVDNGKTWTNIVGATHATVNIGPLMVKTCFRASGCSAYSSSVCVDVTPCPCGESVALLTFVTNVFGASSNCTQSPGSIGYVYDTNKIYLIKDSSKHYYIKNSQPGTKYDPYCNNMGISGTNRLYVDNGVRLNGTVVAYMGFGYDTNFAEVTTWLKTGTNVFEAIDDGGIYSKCAVGLYSCP